MQDYEYSHSRNRQVYVRCPHCFEAQTYENEWYGTLTLDGQITLEFEKEGQYGHTKQEEKFLANVRLCKCGMVVHADMYPTLQQRETIQTHEYQAILKNKNLPEIEKKLRLMEFFPSVYGDVDVLWAHYLDDTDHEKAMEYLHQAIQKIENGELHILYPIFNSFIGDGDHKTRAFFLTEDFLLVDFYRRTGQFKKAQAQCDKLWNGNHRHPSLYMFEWLQAESELIAQKNTNHVNRYWKGQHT